jgi:EmrB/QacA subfamily drug resistance transporter
VAVVVGSGMVFLDSTVVTVALPRIGAELPSQRFGVLEAQSYVYAGYLLTLSALLIPAGALGDHYGRRRLFSAGLVGFAATSILCGIAPTMELLIVGRLLQGVAGALLVPGSLAIITASFEGEARGRAFGIWAGASGAATILGPLIGGILVDVVSWRAVFFLNIPLAALGLWATARYVGESRDESAVGGVDWVGAGLVAIAVGGLTFGAIRGQERAWQDTTAFVAIGAGLVATLLVVPWLARARRPLVPLELFRIRNYTVTNISTLLIYGGLYVTGYFAVVFLQGTLGYNAAGAGVATIPSVVFLAIGSHRFGALAGRHGPRWYMAAGPAVMAVGVLWLSRIPASSTPWRLEAGSLLPPADYLVHVLPGMAVFGIGIMVVVAPLTTALMNSAPLRHSGVASAVNNALSRVGPQFATALLFVAIAATFYDGVMERVPVDDEQELRAHVDPLNPAPADATPELTEAVREASTDAFAFAMIVAAGLMLAGGLVNAAGIRNQELVGSGPPKA